MEVRLRRGNLECVATGTSVEVFNQLDEFTKTFEDDRCGACGCDSIDYVVRKVEDNSFYELHCNNINCRARLSYGHAKDGKSIYPKRYVTDNKGKVVKDENGKSKYLPKNGWVIYTPENKG